MAKGNIILGNLRGPIGDLSFSVVKGQQVSKPRVRKPANPRSLSQCFQRARFAAAVKFFTRGNQALFKFAFEGKRQVESDYNAWMRENVKRAPAISKAALDNYDFPVCAPFIMSKGSLAPMSCAISATAAVVDLGVAAPETAPTTIGELSSLLLQDEKFQAGDIITLVFISSAYADTYPSVAADGSGKCTWTIKQFIIDTTSTDTISDVTGMSYAAAEGIATLSLASGTAPLEGTYAGMTAVHSRNVASGLKVSTQELALNAAATTAYEATQADDYKQEVAAAWKKAGKVDMQPEAILQGSIAYDGEGGSAGFNLPVSTPVVYEEKVGPSEYQPMGVLTGSGPWNFAIAEGMLVSSTDIPVVQIVPKSGFDNSKLSYNANTKPSGANFEINQEQDEIWCMFHNAGSSAIGDVDIDVLYDGQLVVNIKGKIVGA